MRASFVLAFAFGLGASAAAQSRWYVDDSATGANTGTSWTDAFTDLQSALTAASGSAEIWVAEGIYKPSSTGDRTASFRPKETISIYGGFAGTESTLEQRAGLFDRTVLTGDLAGDDGPGFANRSDNSEHVVAPANFAFGSLDGFTIRGGHAATSPGGGAWYTADTLSQVRVGRCTFEDNEAERAGGAVHTERNVASAFEDCLFRGNRASEGGAAYHQPQGQGELSVQRCRFVGNVATGVGGGALAGIGFVAVNCVFAGNSADGTSSGGGAILGNGYFLCNTVCFNHAVGGLLVGGIRGGVNPLSSILWGNFDDRGAVVRSQFENPYSWAYMEGCCLQGWSPGMGGTRMISADPEFVDPLGPDGVAGTLDDDLELGPLSPCVDLLPLDPYVYVDIEGRARNVETRACAVGRLDVGAFERQAQGGDARFCPATSSSLGQPAGIYAPCLLELGGGVVDVEVAPVPDGFGMLLLGDSRTEIPFGNGYLCVAGTVRASSVVATQGDLLHFQLDPATVGGGAIVGGSTWNLQAVYRDRGAGGAGLNASEAIAITVLP